jgi:hypothetical protein
MLFYFIKKHESHINDKINQIWRTDFKNNIIKIEYNKTNKQPPEFII